MVSRRHFLRASGKILGVAGLLVVSARASEVAAQGKGNDRGNGNGGENGKGSGGRGGNEAGGKSKDSRGSSNSDQSKGGASSNRSDRSPAGGLSLGVRHSTGIEETISRGRYIMRDKWGRVIINRRATTADQQRLKSLVD